MGQKFKWEEEEKRGENKKGKRLRKGKIREKKGKGRVMGRKGKEKSTKNRQKTKVYSVS